MLHMVSDLAKVVIFTIPMAIGMINHKTVFGTRIENQRS
jgi:hypothetical protein